MRNLLLIDTDILIDVSKGINEAIDCLQIIQPKYNPAVSVITKMELIVGCRNKKELKDSSATSSTLKI